MGFLGWTILGLIAGTLAKFLMPGKDPGGFIVTILIGVGGSYLGGYVGQYFNVGSQGALTLSSIATATAGALVLLIVYRLVRK